MFGKRYVRQQQLDAGGASGGSSTSGVAALNAPAPSAPQDAGGTASENPSAWYSNVQNQDVRTWVEAKGFKDHTQLAESAYNLEKLIGFDKAGRTIVMPGENASPEEVRAFQSKMGVPEKVDGYKLPVPEGMDGEFAKTAASWFHEAGVSAKAAEQIASKWNESMAAAQQKAEDDFSLQSDLDLKDWKASQGAAAQQNIELAKRAAAQFIPAKDVTERQQIMEKMERAVGTGVFMQMMSQIGSGLAEHKVHSGGDGGHLSTPAQAQQRINELKSNKDWVKDYISGDKSKLNEMSKLMQLAHPNTENQ